MTLIYFQEQNLVIDILLYWVVSHILKMYHNPTWWIVSLLFHLTSWFRKLTQPTNLVATTTQMSWSKTENRSYSFLRNIADFYIWRKNVKTIQSLSDIQLKTFQRRYNNNQIKDQHREVRSKGRMWGCLTAMMSELLKKWVNKKKK